MKSEVRLLNSFWDYMIKNIVSLSLFVAMLFATLSQASADGKAEPLAIEFKDGASTIVLKGSARGDTETDYSVTVEKGQWLMVEVSSIPRDAAAFSITDPQGKKRPSQYAWSETAQESGYYQITVSTLADYSDNRYDLKVTLGARPPMMQYSASDKEGAALYAAMRRFINALQNKDRAAFLASFSRSAPFYALNAQNIGSKTHYRTAVSYSELAADINKKRGLYWTYLERGEGGDRDSFIDNLQGGKAWTRAPGDKFVPPGAELTSSTFVKWRKQGGRWVVDEISYPQA